MHECELSKSACGRGRKSSLDTIFAFSSSNFAVSLLKGVLLFRCSVEVFFNGKLELLQRGNLATTELVMILSLGS